MATTLHSILMNVYIIFLPLDQQNAPFRRSVLCYTALLYGGFISNIRPRLLPFGQTQNTDLFLNRELSLTLRDTLI